VADANTPGNDWAFHPSNDIQVFRETRRNCHDTAIIFMHHLIFEDGGDGMRSSIRLLYLLAGAMIVVSLAACETPLPSPELLENNAQLEATNPINPQAETLIKLAKDIEARGKSKKTALRLYERAVEASGDAPEVVVKLAEAYMRAGYRTQALRAYNAILADNRANAKVLLTVGTALVKAGDTPHGLPALKKSAASLRSFTAYSRLGVAYILSGQFKEARKTLEIAHNLAPDDPNVATNLALVLALSGEHDKAATQMQEVVKSNNADSSHWRNYVLVLAIAGREDQARTAAGSRVPEKAVHELMKRAQAIRSLKTPKARAKVLGFIQS
jgi:Flp pilus assembly protein TadD